MKLLIKSLLLSLILSAYGCVSVNFLPTDDTKSYPPTSSVKVYWEEPKEAHQVIGRLSIQSEDYGEEELFKQLKQKAMSVGAQGIIMLGTNQQSSVVGVPVYGGGTVIAPVTSTRLEAIAIQFNTK